MSISYQGRTEGRDGSLLPFDTRFSGILLRFRVGNSFRGGRLLLESRGRSLQLRTTSTQRVPSPFGDRRLAES